MRARTVKLYSREHGTRTLRAYNRRKTYTTDTIWVLRYAGKWETLDGLTLADAQTKREVREAD